MSDDTPRHYPKARITGGPSPKDLKLEIDGKEVERAFNAELSMGVNQVVALRIHQYIEADVDVEIGMVIEDVEVVVRQPQITEHAIKEWSEVARGSGKTISQALRDAAMKLEPVS